MLFGSDEFSRAFAEKTGNLIGSIFTIGRRKKGRGLRDRSSLLWEWAESRDLPRFESDSLKSLESVEFVKKQAPDLFLVASFGKMIPKELYSTPKHGGINIHPSLLPRYRGMAPVARAIMNGDLHTGVTLHKLSQKIDSGDMIVQLKTDIKPSDDDLSLKLRLACLASDMVKEVLNSLEYFLQRTIPQQESQATWAKAITERDRRITWNMTSDQIVNKCRALRPKPTAYFPFKSKIIQLLDAEKAPELDKDASTSTVLETKPFTVKTLDGAVVLKKLRPSSKREMTGVDFVNGCRISKGELLE